MRFRQLSTARLDDDKAEVARRDHAGAIAELQDAMRSLSDGAGRWEFIARETIESLTGSIKELRIGGLDGDRDGEYLLSGRLISGTSPGNYSLRINGAAGTRYSYLSQNAGTVGGNSASTGILVAPASSDSLTTFTGILRARSRSVRTYEGRGQHFAAANIEQWLVTGEWDDLSANITSLGILNSVAMAAGSWFSLYRRVH